jgi:signal transduction histidine kinase
MSSSVERSTVTDDGGPGSARAGAEDASRSRERVLAALLDATRELMAAGDAGAVCRVAVDAANERLGHDLVGIHLHPEAPLDGPPEKPDRGLEPVAWTDALVPLIGDDPPTIAPGSGVAWESYARDERRVFDDLRAADADLMDPDTAFRSELHVPLGRHGLLLVGSAEVAEFDAEDVYFAEVLGASTAAALDNLAARRAVEARERELARQNRRLEEFTGVVSHDLRNPLSVAMGRLELGLETSDGAPFGSAREDLERVRDALDRMNRLVDGLLTLAREGRSVGDTAPVDPVDVAERAWDTVDTRGATLRTEPVSPLRADPDRLQQLFENLFRNAVEHGSTSPRPEDEDAVEHGSTSSQPGADDAVEHGAADAADLTVTVGPLADGPGFAVADDGCGIPESHRDEVLEHGVSIDEDGTGLGLSIVRTIADAHGWSVTVGEGESGGARFAFRPEQG